MQMIRPQDGQLVCPSHLVEAGSKVSLQEGQVKEVMGMTRSPSAPD